VHLHTGLVEIAIVEKDLRRRSVWLTEKGARRLEAAIPVWRRAQEALAEVIDPRAVRKLAAGTAALAKVVEGIIHRARG
jgi:DNA-binding MarR family transcriptional regulator